MTPSNRRLHRWSFLFMAGSSLKGIVLPGILVLVASPRVTWELWAMWLSVPISIFAVFRYFTTWYSFADDDLIVRTGLWSRNERHIPYARIHNVEMVQGPLHRMLRVAEVRVETAGGSEQEARLRVLSLEAAREMQQRVYERSSRGEIARREVHPHDVAVDATPRVLVRLGLSDLVAFGLAHNRGGIVIGTAIGALWEMNMFDADITTPTAATRRIANALWAEGHLLSDPGVFQLAMVGGVVLAVFAALRLLSIGWSIVTLYRFTLTLAGDELRTSCGLFTRVNGTIPLNRIQLLTVKQAPLQRLLQRVEIRVETAGGEKGASVSRQWLAPALRRERVGDLLGIAMPGAPMASLEWRPVDPRAQQRLWRKSLRIVFGILLPVAFFLPGVVLALLPLLIAYTWFAARKRARGLGYALAVDRVATRAGWLWQHVCLARYAKVQAIRTNETPFDQRWRMASIAADTAGGGWHRIRIRYLGVEDAHVVFRTLIKETGQAAFRW